MSTTASLTALIDTGFDGELLVYVDQLEAIGLRFTYRDFNRVRLADGTEVTLLVASTRIAWHGEAREIDLDVVPAPAPPGTNALIGCRLLRDSRLEIDFPQGRVVVSK